MITKKEVDLRLEVVMYEQGLKEAKAHFNRICELDDDALVAHGPDDSRKRVKANLSRVKKVAKNEVQIWDALVRKSDRRLEALRTRK